MVASVIVVHGNNKSWINSIKKHLSSFPKPKLALFPVSPKLTLMFRSVSSPMGSEEVLNCKEIWPLSLA